MNLPQNQNDNNYNKHTDSKKRKNNELISGN